MQTIEEFMQAYFAECAELHRTWLEKFAPFRKSAFTADYLAALHDGWSEDEAYAREHPPVVQGIEIHGNDAVVFTLEPDLGDKKQIRYLLRTTETGWQIARKGGHCYLCKGTGRRKNGKCKDCNGLGWDSDEEASS